jgi:hypothetical protein
VKLCQLQGKCYEILNTQTLRTKFKHRVSSEFRKLIFTPSATVRLCTDERLQRIPEGLATLIESGLDDCLEERLVAA